MTLASILRHFLLVYIHQTRLTSSWGGRLCVVEVLSLYLIVQPSRPPKCYSTIFGVDDLLTSKINGPNSLTERLSDTGPGVPGSS